MDVDQIRQYAHQPSTHQLLVSLLNPFKQPNDKIHKLRRDGLIESVKKGLYVAGSRLNASKPEPFLLANHILGPSYVSLETALGKRPVNHVFAGRLLPAPQPTARKRSLFSLLPAEGGKG